MSSTTLLLAVAGLAIASTAQAQAPERALMSRFAIGSAGAIAAARTTHSHSASDLTIAGERALLGRFEIGARSTGSAGFPAAPIDGAGALLGRPLSAGEPAPAISPVRPGSARRSSFAAQVRGDVTASASGEAVFGPPVAGGAKEPAFVVSLGVHDSESAILFTRMNGGPLGVGRYRIADMGNAPEEISALVVTGPTTSPTGVFRGSSGWLVVTAATDRMLVGQFQVEGEGFLAAHPEREDRPVSVAGSFSALATNIAR